MSHPNRFVRRARFSCTECHKSFDEKVDLYMHSEVCLMEAFEVEARAIFTEMPDLKQNDSVHSMEEPVPTISNKNVAKIKNAPKTTPKNKKLKNKSVGYDIYGLEDTRIIEGCGLRLVVSVEYPSKDGDNDIDEDVSVPGLTINRDGDPEISNEDCYKPKMECPTCGLVLYRHNFSTHYRIHTGEMPFICQFCEKRFRTTSSLKIHLRAHTGEKPYNCPRCDYACITKRNLDRHIMNNHVREGGTKTGPRYRRSRYRLTDSHHEDYLMNLARTQAELVGEDPSSIITRLETSFSHPEHFEPDNEPEGGQGDGQVIVDRDTMAQPFVLHLDVPQLQQEQ